MVFRKLNKSSFSCLNPLLSYKFILFYFIIIICVICTSYEYIINISVGNTKYATFVGVGMIAQLREEKLEADRNITKINPSTVSRNLGGTNYKKISNEQQMLIKELKYNTTESKEPDSKIPKIETSIIQEIDINSKEGDLISHESTTENTSEQMNNETMEKCSEIPLHLQGKLTIVKEVLDFSTILKENPTVLPGGEDSPANCSTRHNVAIIIPYRDRSSQLAVFLRHIHSFLRRQDLHYRIYIINQADEHLFNRAMLMNVGFTEAMQDYSWDCCIFHDVDLLPEDDRNLYTCPTQPRHMSVAVDKFKYKLPYKTIFGGVAALSVDQFRKLNGFSNQFWGWGGEDDDMSKRIHYHRLRISRYKPEIARYTMIKHKQEKVNKERARVLRTSHRRYKTDGLNSLKYKVLSKELLPLYTFVSVVLSKPGTQRRSYQEEVINMQREKYKKQKDNIHQWYKNNVHPPHNHHK